MTDPLWDGLAGLAGNITTHLTGHLDGDSYTNILDKVYNEIISHYSDLKNSFSQFYLYIPALKPALVLPLELEWGHFCTPFWVLDDTSFVVSAWALDG